LIRNIRTTPAAPFRAVACSAATGDGMSTATSHHQDPRSSADTRPLAAVLTLPRREPPPPAPCLREARCAPCPPTPHRIWEVDADTVLLVLALLLDPRDAAGMLAEVDGEPRAAGRDRDDLVLREAAARCRWPCRLAESIEAALDGRAGAVVEQVRGAPLIALADRWAAERECLGGREAAALLWALSRDARPELDRLAERVRGEVWLRALRAFAAPLQRA
jgi:hypothetical protein